MIPSGRRTTGENYMDTNTESNLNYRAPIHSSSLSLAHIIYPVVQNIQFVLGRVCKIVDIGNILNILNVSRIQEQRRVLVTLIVKRLLTRTNHTQPRHFLLPFYTSFHTMPFKCYLKDICQIPKQLFT